MQREGLFEATIYYLLLIMSNKITHRAQNVCILSYAVTVLALTSIEFGLLKKPNANIPKRAQHAAGSPVSVIIYYLRD